MMFAHDPLGKNDPMIEILNELGSELPPPETEKQLSLAVDRWIEQKRREQTPLRVHSTFGERGDWRIGVLTMMSVVAAILCVALVPWFSNDESTHTSSKASTVLSHTQSTNPWVEMEGSSEAGSYLVATNAQVEGQLRNGDFEVRNGNRPVGWMVPEPSLKAGYRVESSQENVFHGEWSVLMTGEPESGSKAFGNLMQSIDATPFLGKRIRFRAYVCTKDLSSQGQAQLWVRIDRKAVGGGPAMGAFDNMQDRPIRGSEWKPYEIVLDVADDAKQVVLGAILIGAGKAWIDKASFEVVETNISTTGQGNAMNADGGSEWRSALPWLMLASMVLIVILGSQFGSNPFQRIALRFTSCYFVFYSLPGAFAILVPLAGMLLTSPYAISMDGIVRWTSKNLLGIERQLVAPNGSGDTTFDYVRLLVCVMISLVVTAAWSVFQRNQTDDTRHKDLLRSFLRYTVAFAMIGYGMAKIVSVFNQFPPPSYEQLMKTYGESSPMNLLWTFMGSSRLYTQFGGLLEWTGGVLLLFRRTSTLGAILSFAVLWNIFMLNLCYDVPVKQYSFHLLLMSLVLLLQDAPRLLAFFVGNSRLEPQTLRVRFQHQGWEAAYWGMKCYLLAIGLLLPLGNSLIQELQGAKRLKNTPSFFGTYVLHAVKEESGTAKGIDLRGWESITLRRSPWGEPPVDTLVVRQSNGALAYYSINLHKEGNQLTIKGMGGADPMVFRYQLMDENHLSMTQDSGDRRVTIVFKKNLKQFLLTGRGFHWINEYPFNR